MAEFKNPNQQGGGQDSRSLFVMMFVMLAVFFGLSYFRQKSNPRTVSPNAPTAQTQPAQQPPPAAPTAAQPANDLRCDLLPVAWPHIGQNDLVSR